MEALRRWYSAREPREQRILGWGGLVAAALVLVLVLQPWWQHRQALAERVARKSADAAMAEALVPGLVAAGPLLSAGSTDTLVVVVDRMAREAGLADALQGSQPLADQVLRVELRGARFNNLMMWLARMAEQAGVVVVAARFEGTEESGRVDVTLELRRPGDRP
jgi:general secretion pathway protein M